MENDSVKAITVKLPELSLFHRGFVRKCDGVIFWAMHYAHGAAKEAGLSQKLRKFISAVVMC